MRLLSFSWKHIESTFVDTQFFVTPKLSAAGMPGARRTRSVLNSRLLLLQKCRKEYSHMNPRKCTHA